MVELIAKISKGTKMDQVYIPKSRQGMMPGDYVVVTLLTGKLRAKPQGYFRYNVKELEPIKLEILEVVFSIIEKGVKRADNIIITGSFLEKGFNFNDLDILIITSEKINEGEIKKKIAARLGISADLVILNNKSLIQGLNTDPLYQMMLSRCIAKKRIIYKIKKKINYKILDIHLLNSKALIDSFDILTGKEKYYLTRNLISIKLFLEDKKLSNAAVDKAIKEEFREADIKNNVINKSKFLLKYKNIYDSLFNKIMNCIKDGAKQKPIN
jgi:predicted nucleotidyltransferase